MKLYAKSLFALVLLCAISFPEIHCKPAGRKHGDAKAELKRVLGQLKETLNKKGSLSPRGNAKFARDGSEDWGSWDSSEDLGSWDSSEDWGSWGSWESWEDGEDGSWDWSDEDSNGYEDNSAQTEFEGTGMEQTESWPGMGGNEFEGGSWDNGTPDSGSTFATDMGTPSGDENPDAMPGEIVDEMKDLHEDIYNTVMGEVNAELEIFKMNMQSLIDKMLEFLLSKKK